MPRRIDQLPPDATALARRIAALEREVRELRASRRASWATIGGGDTTITGARVQTAETGRRVVLDADGTMTTYDDDGHVTNYTGGEDNVVYNQQGWDPDGTPDGEWVGFSAGNFLMGVGDGGNWQDRDQTRAGLLGVIGTGWASVWQSLGEGLGSGGFEDQAFAVLMAGTPGGQPGTISAPAIQTYGDVAAAGTMVKLTGAFDTPSWRYVPESWHTPTYTAAWAGGSTSGTYQAYQYRQDVEDNVDMGGLLHAVSTVAANTPSSVFTLPTGYRPKVAQRVDLGTFVTPTSPLTASAAMIVNSTGLVQIVSSAAIAANQNFSVPPGTKFPLGNRA